MPNAIYPDEQRPDKLDGFLKRHEWAAPFCEEKKVLDLGCGSGYGASIYGKNADVTGMDMQHGEFIIKTYPNISYIFQDIRDPIPHEHEGVYDVVCMFEVLEHFQWESGAWVLRNAFKALKPGCLFIGSTPRAEKKTRHYLSRKDGDHCVIYDDTDIKKQLSIFNDLQFHDVVSWAHVWTCRKG